MRKARIRYSVGRAISDIRSLNGVRIDVRGNGVGVDHIPTEDSEQSEDKNVIIAKIVKWEEIGEAAIKALKKDLYLEYEIAHVSRNGFHLYIKQ